MCLLPLFVLDPLSSASCWWSSERTLFSAEKQRASKTSVNTAVVTAFGFISGMVLEVLS